MSYNSYDTIKQSLLDESEKISDRWFQKALKALAKKIEAARSDAVDIEATQQLFQQFEQDCVKKYTNVLTSSFNNIYNHYKSIVVLDIQSSLQEHMQTIQQANDTPSSWWFISKIVAKTKRAFGFLSVWSFTLWVSWAVLWKLGFKKYEQEIKKIGRTIKSKAYDAYVAVATFLWFDVIDKDELIDDDTDEDYTPDEHEYWLIPWRKLWYAEARNRLTEYYNIFSSARWILEDWSSRAWNRTCLEWLRTDTVIWARRLARAISNRYKILQRPTITWWTEEWHAPWRYSHAEWFKLDIRAHDSWWQQCIKHYWLRFGIKQTVTLQWQRITFFYHGKDPHLDVFFHLLPAVEERLVA
jgi:hypothetical protein